MQKNILIIIPVLNEVKNIEPLVKKIKFHLKGVDKNFLFIDDNSTDGPREKIHFLQKKYKNKVYLIKRKKKLGIGSAHKCGLKWGFKKKYKIIITMDSDGTHNPIYISQMIKLLNKKKCSITSTNRFLDQKSLVSWSLWRRFLTSLRHLLIKFMLGISFDSSGAFRGYMVNKVKLKDILLAKNNSYSFFWESIYILSKKYSIKEISIRLPARKSGDSKMRLRDILSALFYLTFSLIKRFII